MPSSASATVVVDHNAANYVHITDSYFLQDAPVSPAGSPLAVLANDVSVEVRGFADLSGNITGPLLAGSAAGVVALDSLR